MRDTSKKMKHKICATITTFLLLLLLLLSCDREEIITANNYCLTEAIAAEPWDGQYRFPTITSGTFIYKGRQYTNGYFPHYHHDYPAADIDVAVKSPLYAPVSGKILYIHQPGDFDWNLPETYGGGRILILGDDGLWHYLSHNSEIWACVGDRVLRGEQIGLTGMTGNAVNTHPHIHYGINVPGSNVLDWQHRRGGFPFWPALQAWHDGNYLASPWDYKP